MSDTTPPNWPIYNVNLSDEQISDIVSKVFTDSGTITKSNLGKKKSFNNRIYFVHIEHQVTESDLPQDVVLKVNGRFFGSSKVQNEVACLLLLQQFCPDVPAPRVLAWSEDGSRICALRNGVFAALYDEVIEPEHVSSQTPTPGWIMTSKLPGRILQRSELSPTDDGLITELADIVASWRTKIPYRTELGNLALQPADYTSSNSFRGLEITAGRLIQCETQPSSTLSSSASYYTHLLSDQIHKIETKDVFAYVRLRLLDKLQSFRDHKLAPLLTLSSHDAATFTQQDFAPRNILVEESEEGRLHVSGIVDFEFAGFFPQAEDFLTCRIRQHDDWPEDVFESFCSALTSLGLSVPGYNCEKKGFAVLGDLAVLIEYVAPWWFEDGHITGQPLEEQLAETCKVVEEKIEKLSRK